MSQRRGPRRPFVQFGDQTPPRGRRAGRKSSQSAGLFGTGNRHVVGGHLINVQDYQRGHHGSLQCVVG